MTGPAIKILQDNRIKVTNRGTTRMVVGGSVPTPAAGVDIPTHPIAADEYTMDDDFSGVWHLFSGSGCAITIPLGLRATAYFPILQADGAGLLTFIADGGVTLLNKLGHSVVSTGPARAELAPGGLNIWHLNGDTE